MAEKDERNERIASSIRVVPNFPKPGIMFQDITTLLLDPQAFKDTVDLFVERYIGKSISVVAVRSSLQVDELFWYGTADFDFGTVSMMMAFTLWTSCQFT
ncbi:adenine phosphoribosyltransferase 1-like [Asparagus officinalis]|uniref:adenine phosphoribosyltransferase 1-like n=1 Tax=Asparagus officinalis TaxID=4686 RepID=UPI00098E3C43|nr:adenine phosphoribosyltransferase 1-like [Asparagus officinalis]